MSDTWGNRGQTSDRDPGRLCPEHGYLIGSAASITAAMGAYVVDATLPVELNRGLYALLVSMFVAGFVGWLVRSAERRVRQDYVRLAGALEELREQVAQPRVTYLPGAPRQHEGQRHVGAVAVGAEDDAHTTSSGIDPDSIDALRRINTRLRSVDTE